MSELLLSIEPWAESWGPALWRAAWQGGIAIAAAWAVARWCTFLSPRITCWLWRLVCLKLLVALVWIEPITIPLLPAEAVARARVPMGSPRVMDSPRAVAAAPQFEARPLVTQADPPQSIAVSSLLLSVWAACVLGRMLMTAGQWISVRRLCRSAEPARSSALDQACQHEADRLGLARLPLLRLSARVESPLLAGIWRPTIVLPEGALEMFDEAELRLMLAHELAHLKRRDLCWNWLPSVVGWVYFFHPLVWLMTRHWCEAQEAACDELLIQRRLAQPADYGRLLLKLAVRWPREPQSAMVAAGVLGAYRNLERRILAMARVKPVSRPALFAAALVLLIAAAPGIIPWRLVAQQAEPAVQAARVAPINPATPSGEDKNTAAPPGKRVHGEAHHRAVAELEKLGALVYSDAARGTTVVIADHWTGGDAPLALLPDVDDLKVLILNGAKVTPAGFVNLRRLPSSTLLQLTDATEDQIASLKGAENLTGLMISGDRLTDAGLAALATLPNLKNLQIIQNGKDSAVTDAGIAALKTCAELVQLGISGCSKVTGCTLGELAGLPRLQDLWLLQIPLADEGFSQLAKLPRLKRLTVTASLKTDSGVVTQVTPAGFGALKKLTSLERLSLNEAIGLDDTAAANLANLRELRLLRLAQVKLTDAGLAHLAGLTNLRELAVWNGNYTDAGLAHLKGLAKMRRLSISGNANISDTALRNLAAMTDLRRLELTSNRLTDDSLTALAEFKALESLGLPGLRIRGTGLERITGLAKLRNISLGRSLITDDQLPVFAQFPALEELDLADTAITDAGLASLGRLQKLTRLELVDTKITDAGLEKLDGLKQLRNLGLAGTQVTKSGVQRLNQKLPQLQIGADWTVAFGTLQLDVADDEPAAADAAKPEAAKSEAKPVAVTPDKAGAVEKRGPQEDNVLRKLRLDGARLLAQMVKEAGYALPADRDLLRVPPPFSPLRAEYYRVGHPHQADSIPTGASAMVFHWEKNSLRNWGMTFSVSVPPGAGYNLTGLVDGLLGIKDQMIDVPADLLEEQIPGDWVIRPRVADEQIIRQLDAILQNELSLKLHMEFRQVPRRVYVARGNYRLTPLPGNSGKDTTSYEDKTVETDRIEIFSKHLIPDSGSGGGTGKFDEFLDWLGQWVGAPIVSEVGTRPKGEVTWRLHGRSPFTKEMRAEDRDASQVLANITAQTGLTFKEETRSVKILFVESTK